jgi:predicted HicB family RNase H-like nuclease
MNQKATMGRPPKGDERRSARIGLRAVPSDKERYERAASKAGITLSDWIKTRLDRAAKRELGD